MLASLSGLPMLMIWPSQRPARVLDDPEEALDAVGDVGEATPLSAAVDQLDRRAVGEVHDQLSERARAADARGVE